MYADRCRVGNPQQSRSFRRWRQWSRAHSIVSETFHFQRRHDLESAIAKSSCKETEPFMYSECSQLKAGVQRPRELISQNTRLDQWIVV